MTHSLSVLRMRRLVRLAIALTVAAPSPAIGQAVESPRAPAPSRGLAELPRALPPLPRELAGRPCTRSVKAGGNLQDAIDRAKGGDVLCLSRGARYQGNFVLRSRPDTGWVVLRTDVADAEVARPGERVRPSTSGPLAKLVSKATDLKSAIRTAPGTRGWYLALLEVTTDSMIPQGPTALITFGGGPGEGREGDREPAVSSHLVLDRVYAHGWPDQTLRRCLALNSGAAAVVDSWLDDCHEKGSDSQAIAAWGGAGPFLIENNTLAGAGENIMFGGSDPRTHGLSPSDVTVRRNHIVTPPEWKGRWTRKNLLETKNVRRLLVEENVMEGSWSDGQDGWAILLKSANQNGRCTWCVSADIVIRRNLIRNVGAGIAVNGRGGDRGNIDSVSRRIEVTENYVEQVGVPPYRGVGRLFMFLTGTDGLLVSQNTLIASAAGSVNASVVVGSPKQVTARGFVFERNLLTRGKYAITGCGGPRMFLQCLPGARVSGNVLVGATRPDDRQMQGFTGVASEAGGGRAGVSRSSIERATSGVVVPR